MSWPISPYHAYLEKLDPAKRQGRVKTDWFDTLEDARAAMEKKTREKIRKGYRARDTSVR